MNSYITTFFGILAAIGAAVLAGIQTGVIDAATLPHWVKGLAGILSVIGTAGMGIAARDNGKSSEDVGAKSQSGFLLPKTLFLAFSVSLAVLLLMTGCGTPQKTALRTAGATIVSVDAAMSEWGEYVKLNHPPASQEQAVKDAFEKYQAAMVAVCDAGAIYAGSNTTNAPAAAALQTAIGKANDEIADLERLISIFGVTLH